ncbi:hypothetical protein TPE_0702 [Treponema pedis str. T A4]|uniref:Type I restriction modification DNA specificity domain-containing protein n=2 Tax=Treponema pedis TaxID=409322 RepID=S5ZYP1_9SPIR|nr:hypothetical protein TPE_0702 [Treponema pedis str. T A4]
MNKKNILPEFLYIFCKTNFFIIKMLRNNTASLYPAILNSDILNCRIPILPITFQQKVATLVKSAHTNLETAKQKYSEAENLLLETLQLKDFHIANEPVNIKSIKESFLKTGRLDAEFYQRKYEEYWNLIKSHSYVFIRDEYTNITTKPEWKNKLYQYIEIGDVNINDGSYQSHWIEYKELPANAKIQAKQGDVLISTVRPYRGAVTIVCNDDKDLIVSGAFTVLRKKPHSGFNTEVLKVLLRSELYKDWLLQFNVGTSYPVIKDEDILNLPIPVIAKEYQTKIAEYIQKAQALREEAKSLLENAKLQVEKEISANSSILPPPPPEKIIREITYYYRLAEWTLYEAVFNVRFAHLNVTEKTLKNSFLKIGRLDAEFYQEKYDRILNKITQHNFYLLKDIVTIKKSIEPGSDSYDTEGLPFIRVADYDKAGVSKPAKYLSEKFCNENQDLLKNLMPKKNTILFSKDGSVGIAYLLTEDLYVITSSAILHLDIKKKKEILPEYVTLVLNSVAVKMQAERDTGGSIIQHWQLTAIENIIIPVVPIEIQREIAKLINMSFTLKAESEALLEKAKKMVEDEIEK